MSGRELKLLTPAHRGTPRDYSQRAGSDKPRLASLARNFGFDYWDGDRKTGYGGYKNDGRWKKIARELHSLYGLGPESAVLDVGCGKGFLLDEFRKISPSLHLAGIDVSDYAIQNAEITVKNRLQRVAAQEMNFPPNSFDLVISLNTLHNLELPELLLSLRKIQEISRKSSYICVESYRNENEKWNLLRWQLTCESFFSPREWKWVFDQAGYTGDYEFIFFE